MNSVAVITEFNPFHNGNKILGAEIKKKYHGSVIMAIMSGNCVQRGDFSVFDKYTRAGIAVLNGYDLVFELPFPYSCSAAEQFAAAGASIAERLGADVLAFGSESGDQDKLIETAGNQLSKEYSQKVNEICKESGNESLIKVQDRVYRQLFGERIPAESNDILACEYLKSIMRRGYRLQPFAVHRVEDYSATESRKAIYGCDENAKKRLLPYETGNIQFSMGLNGIENLILGALRLGYGSDPGNGIINALRKLAEKSASLEELTDKFPTKTYTSARLRREIMAWLFGATDEDKNSLPGYTVLLSANKKGLEYLSRVKRQKNIPVLTRQSDVNRLDETAARQYRASLRPESVYPLTFNTKKSPKLTVTPIIVNT